MNKKNLANGQLLSSITDSQTTLDMKLGQGADFPNPPFFITVTPLGMMSTVDNSEIMEVTNVSVDTFTVVRGQRGSQQFAFAGDSVVVNGIYVEDVDDRAMFLAAHPVGSVWITKSSADPNVEYGGTWIHDFEEMAIVGVKVGSTNFGNVNDTFGAATNTIAQANLPSYNLTGTAASGGAHSHTITVSSGGEHTHTGTTNTTGAHTHATNQRVFEMTATSGTSYQRQSGQVNRELNSPSTVSAGDHSHTVTIPSGGAHSHSASSNSTGAHTHSVTVASGGSGTAVNNIQPSQAVHIWTRTA